MTEVPKPTLPVTDSCGCVWRDLNLPCKTEGCRVCQPAPVTTPADREVVALRIGVVNADLAVEGYRAGFEAAKQMAMDALMRLSANASANAMKPGQPHSWQEALTRDAECYDEARDVIRAMEPPYAE